MINYLEGTSPVVQALIATLFTWFITLLGSALVFLFKKINKNILDSMLSLSAGIMIAASFFSLLLPAIELADNIRINSWLITAIGFISGGLFLLLGDHLYEKASKKRKKNNKRIILLILSTTLHNIPEGLAVGVAFGTIRHGIDGATFARACILALGIGLQNFPEGCAVSIPLRREGLSRGKAFFWG